MYILIIEDTTSIAHNEKAFLELEWHTVDLAYDWEEWLRMALDNTYDLIVLDLMLPKVDGIQVCQQLRWKKKTPIIMTTAKWQLEDKGEWFYAGADDYLVKPFALEELVMRINAITKRTELPNVYRLAYDIEVLPDEQRVIKKWEDIKFTLKEYLLIEYLAQRQWQAISRTDLIDYIRWWDTRENDATLDVYIANVRKKLGKESIETIKWYGYKMA